MIYDFNDLKENGMMYGGHAGNKLGVFINGENWFLKFPQSTRNLLRKVDISYSTSSLSEYIGSHVYEIIGIPVHETLLGVKDNKVVVACRDFRINSIDFRFEDFNSIKNVYVQGLEEKLSSTISNMHMISLEEIMIIMDNNPLFLKDKSLKKRFWDMFIVDALIGNNDRNNGNWGVIVNNKTGDTVVSPVFDNGASFNTKSSDEQISKILSDYNCFEDSVYKTRLCIFSLNGRQINPFEYMEKLENEDCNEALVKLVPNINLDKIKKFIYDIPNDFNGVFIISDVRKEFYFKCLEYRYNKLCLMYEKLKNR